MENPYQLEPVNSDDRSPTPRHIGSIGGGSVAGGGRPGPLHAIMASAMSLVLAGVVVELLTSILDAVVSGMANSSGSPKPDWAVIVDNLGRLVGASLVATGWWKATTPLDDLAFPAGRGALRALAAGLGVTVWLLSLGALAGHFLGAGPIFLLGMLIGLLAYLVVWIAIYFVQMIFLASYATGIGQHMLASKARRMLWLGPLLCTVGLVILIGPFIALILYVRILTSIRELARRQTAFAPR